MAVSQEHEAFATTDAAKIRPRGYPQKKAMEFQSIDKEAQKSENPKQPSYYPFLIAV